MNVLEQLREAQGLTQEELATKVGIAVSTYSMYVNGHRTIPKTVAERIAKVVGCKIEEIFLPEKFTVSKSPPGKSEEKESA